MFLLIVFAITYFRIARQYNKNPYLWGFIGAGIFVGIQFFLAFLIGILFALEIIPTFEDQIASIIAAIIAAFVTYFIYSKLKKKWEKEDTTYSHNIEEIGRNDEANQL